VIFENARVRVLDYHDKPGDRTLPHRHPDSVLYPLASFHRRITSGDQQAEVELHSGQVRWVAAQEHAGENIGDTDTHALFIELKEPPSTPSTATLGPSAPQGV
jgi:hypothetical protein